MAAEAPHLAYAQQVVNGQQVAGELVKLACQRALDDHARQSWDFIFDWRYAERAIRFFRLLPHVKGEWARRGETFNPAPWQYFFLCELYGWRVRGDLSVRRFIEALLLIGKKNGKTYKAGGAGLYELLFGDSGTEVYSVATKKDQAKLVWSAASDMLRRMPPEVRAGVKTLHSKIVSQRGEFSPLGRDSKTLDGLSPVMAVVDEAGAVTDRNVTEALLSGMGARRSPLLLFITTAHFTRDTLFHERMEYSQQVLRGRVEDSRVLSLLYGLDRDDDYRDEAVWQKANPNLGVSLSRDFLADQIRKAGVMPQAVQSVLCKHFNRWSSTASGWIGVDVWHDARAGAPVRSGHCFIGVDLAQSLDLTAVTRIWVNEDGRWSVDFACWLPRASYDGLTVSRRASYDQAVAAGVLRLTEGQVTDYGEVEAYLRSSCQDYEVMQVGFDPYNATTLVNRLEEEGLPVLTVPQSIAKLNGPTKELQRRIHAGGLRYLPSAFIDWQLEGCHVFVDVNENHKVRRGEDKSHPIDSWVAFIIAVACVSEGAQIESGFTYMRF